MINECIISVVLKDNSAPLKRCLIAIYRNLEERADINVIRVSNFLTTCIKGLEEIECIENDFICGAIKICTPLREKELTSYLEEVIKTNSLESVTKLIKETGVGSPNIEIKIISWNRQIINNDYYTKSYIMNAIDEVR